jgi:putative MATE family efflux protein
MRTDSLIRQPIPPLVRQIAVPASVGYFFNTMFNVVDTYFAGLISTQALASLSLSFPVFFVIIAAGTGISTGTTALIANALGAGDRDAGKRIGIQGITFGVLASIVLTLIGVHASPLLFSALGASGPYLTTCLAYMNTLFLGTVFFILAYMLNAILNALGDTRSFRNFLMAGFFLNILLDPWFIYGGMGIPPLGIGGVAAATLLIQFLGCVYLGRKVYKTGFVSHKEVRDILPNPHYLMEIARQGFPASVNMMTVGMGIFVITFFVSRFGEEAVAAYGIATRVEQVALLPTIGLNVATLTLVAQNNGAGLFHRIQETVRTVLRYGGVLMGAAAVLVFVFAGELMACFTDEREVVRIGAVYLRIAAFLLYAYVILFVHVAALQGVKKPMFAVWMGLCRQILLPMLVFYGLAYGLGLGLRGIWWGIFSINWIAALFTMVYAPWLLKKAHREGGLATAPGTD